MRKILVGIGGAVLMAATFASPAFAAAAHTHQVDTPGQGDPSIAPGFCQEAAYSGFSEFHSNVHLAGVFNSSDQVSITGVTFCE